MTEQQPILRAPEGTNLAGEDTGREALSHTRIGVLNACWQKYDFKYEQRLEQIQTPRSLGLGRAFAIAREHGDPEAGVAALQEEWSSTPGMDAEKLLVEQSIVRGAAAAYMRRWPSKYLGTPPRDINATVTEQKEVEYRVRLRNPWTGHYSNTFDLLGRADGVIDKGGYLELIEDKFVGRVDNLSVGRLPLDRQVTLACYGLWRATGKEVRVIHYRFTKKPSIKQRQNETLDQFCARVEGDYFERGESFYTHGETMFRTADDLLRVEQELWVWADELRAARRRELFPRNTGACSEFGGCPYIPLCVGDPDASTLFRVKEERS